MKEKPTIKKQSAYSFLALALSLLFVIAGCRQQIEPPAPSNQPAAVSLQAIEHNKSGIELAKSEDYEQAIIEFSRALEIDERFVDAYINRGLAYQYIRENKNALADFSKAISLAPSDSIIYNYRGNSYSNLKEFDNAITDHSKAIELDPEYAPSYNSRGNAFAGKKEYEIAILDYDRAIEIAPDYALAYYNRGVTYATIGNKAWAIDDLTACKNLATDPKLVQAAHLELSALLSN